LHETEFIRPWAKPFLKDEKPLSVYLVGFLYAQDSLVRELAGWRMALDRMQLGGERGYGWGRLRLEFLSDCGIHEEPAVKVEKDSPILAHVRGKGANIIGPLEPLVGWGRYNAEKRAKKWHISSATICHAPGAVVTTESTFTIDHYGIWE